MDVNMIRHHNPGMKPVMQKGIPGDNRMSGARPIGNRPQDTILPHTQEF
jgi:hypothetical protein